MKDAVQSKSCAPDIEDNRIFPRVSRTSAPFIEANRILRMLNQIDLLMSMPFSLVRSQLDDSIAVSQRQRLRLSDLFGAEGSNWEAKTRLALLIGP